MAAASGEGFDIGVKLADPEAHLIRLFAFLLLAASAAVLIHEWHHKADTKTATTLPATIKCSRKHSRSRASRTR